MSRWILIALLLVLGAQSFDSADAGRVDHVRLVARAQSDEARIVLKMEK